MLNNLFDLGTIYSNNVLSKKLSKMHFQQRLHTLSKINLVRYVVPKKVFAIAKSSDILNKEFVIMYLLFVGIYPNAKQLNRTQNLYFNSKSQLDLLDYFGQEIENSDNPKNFIYLKEKDADYIDSTHTASLNFTTGIQRVVRNLISSNDSKISVGFWNESATIFKSTDLSQSVEIAEATFINSEKNDIVNELLFDKKILIADTLKFRSDLIEKYGLLSKFNSIASVFYDDIPLRTPDFTDSFTRSGFPYYLKTILSISKVIFTISQTQENHLNNWAVFFEIEAPAKSIRIPLASFCEDSHASISKKTIKPDYRHLLLVGTFDRRKNVLQIFELLREVPLNIKVKISIIGAGGHLLEDYLSILSWFPRYDIQLLKNIDDKKLHELYLEADLTFFLSLAEGYGLPVVESIHHATPVIILEEESVVENCGKDGVLILDKTPTNFQLSKLRELFIDDYMLKRFQQETYSNVNLNSNWSITSKLIWENI